MAAAWTILWQATHPKNANVADLYDKQGKALCAPELFRTYEVATGLRIQMEGNRVRVQDGGKTNAELQALLQVAEEHVAEASAFLLPLSDPCPPN